MRDEPRLFSGRLASSIGSSNGVRILESARKHGFRDEDIRHAVDNFIRRFPNQGLHDATILIGPARDGVTLMEIGIIEDPKDPRVIHANKARAKYLH